MADSLGRVWEQRLQQSIAESAGPSTIAYVHAALALQYAYRGDQAAALRHADLAVATYSVAADALNYRGVLSTLADVYLVLGDKERAMELLEQRLSAPGGRTSAILRLDPLYDPLRTYPRFQALLENYDPPLPVPLN